MFLQKKNVYKQLMNYIFNDVEVPIILNGNKTHFKKDFCKIFCEINNITFNDYYFNDFILKKPFNHKIPSMIYVNDFLVDSGRYLNEYEKYVLLNINQKKHLIILESTNIDKIMFKSESLINRFKKIYFPDINKEYIQNYIYYCINFNKYSHELYLLNWLSYDIDKLNIEKIDILLNILNNLFLEKKDFSIVHTYVNTIIDSI
jgi:hypothetical protein